MSRLRILIVTVWFPRTGDPTRQVFVRSHALAAARHHDVRVLHLVDGTGPIRRVDAPSVTAGLDVLEVPTSDGRLPGVLARSLAGARALAALGDWRPDLVHAHMIESAAPAWWAARRMRVPWVLTEHYSGFAMGNATRGQRTKVRLLANRADRVLPVSRAMRDTLTGLGVDRPMTIVGNPFDPDRFHPPAGPPAAGRLITVGRLHPVKGQDVLLHALADLPASPEWHLDVVGDGPERARLVEMGENLGLSDRVTWHGAVVPADVPRLLRAADTFVAPSRYETQGAAAVEALASGCRLIASDIGGLAEVAGHLDALHGHVRLVPAEDPARLAEALAATLGTPRDPADAALVASEVMQRWSLDAVADRLDEVYAAISGGRRR